MWPIRPGGRSGICRNPSFPVSQDRTRSTVSSSGTEYFPTKAHSQTTSTRHSRPSRSSTLRSSLVRAAELEHQSRTLSGQADMVAGQRENDARERRSGHVHGWNLIAGHVANVAHDQDVVAPIIAVERGLGFVHVVRERGLDSAALQPGSNQSHAGEELSGAHCPAP